MSKPTGGVFMNKLSKQDNLKLIKSNSTKILHPTHSLIVRKLNLKEKSSNIIKSEINDYLNLPEKFLSSNSKVIIGKKVKLKNMNVIGIEPIIQKKITAPNKRMSLYRKSFHFSNNNIDSSSKNFTGPTYHNMKEKQQYLNDKCEIIDNEQLKKIFNKYKTFQMLSKNDEKKNDFTQLNDKINKNNIKIFCINNISTTKAKKSRNIDIPLDITQSLIFQYNKKKIRQNLDNKIKNISKRLSRILNKNEDDLLLNRADDYSFKN